MFSGRLTFVLITIAILIDCDLIVARTRYEEFDFKGCETELQQSLVATSQLQKRRVPLITCATNCQLRDYPHGGCDCITKKCVCANMNLDFCNFQKVRLYI